MELFRAHAYSVSPSKGKEEEPEVIGGVINPSAELKMALSDAGKASRLSERTEIEFNVDQVTRTCDMRNRLLEFGFGTSEQAKNATSEMSKRLSVSMDNRSSNCLFLATSYKIDESKRTNILWVFPRDDAFQLTRRGEEPIVQLLTDIFAKSSHLRKGAVFSGANTRTGHLQGKAYDNQSGSKSIDAADFWIVRFLDCRLMITEEQGTKIAADTFKKFYKQATTLSSKEAAFGAMLALRHSRKRKWSLRKIANDFFSEEDAINFLNCAPNRECRNSIFTFSKTVFEERVGTRVFQLDTEVIVASPFDEIGKSVLLNGSTDRKLSCKGTVVDEKIRKPHAKPSR